MRCKLVLIEIYGDFKVCIGTNYFYWNFKNVVLWGLITEVSGFIMFYFFRHFFIFFSIA